MSDDLKASIARILRSGSHNPIGAGFLVSEKHVLTCAHVVAQALGLQYNNLEQPKGTICLDFPLTVQREIFNAHVVFWLPAQPGVSQLGEEIEDIAILELELPPSEITHFVRFVTANDLWGHPFRTFGFPTGYDNGVWASGILRDKQASNWLQIEDVKVPGYSVIQGFSGAPVWDEQLNGVVGMVVESDRQLATKAAYIIPSSLLMKAWPYLDQSVIPPCPYRGLFTFREQDAEFFFGREIFIQHLVMAVQKKSFVAVIGSSGSGKSSVVFAGLLPHLRQKENWQIITFRPSDLPLRALATALIPRLEPALSETDRMVEINKLAEHFRDRDIELRDVAERIMQKHSVDHLLLVIDQFEELYTLCKDVVESQYFLEALLVTVSTPPSPKTLDVKLIITLRADFLGYAYSSRLFSDAMQNNDLIIGPMTRQELRDAIEKPAQKLKVKVQDGLTERVLDAVGQEPGNLPLLEFTLTLLWDKQHEGELTHTAYDEIGGVVQSLAVYAEKVYTDLTKVEQIQAKRIFIQLVRPGEGTEDTRRLAARAEVGEENWPLVVFLSDARLLVTGRNNATGEDTVEVAHEALIRAWKRFQEWMEQDRKFRLWQERLRSSLRQWEVSKKENDSLLRGVLLEEAENWLDERPNDISAAEKTFIQTSMQPDERDVKAMTVRFAVGKFNEYLLWFVIVLVLTMLIRFVLLLLGADPTSLFTGFIYALSDILLLPFFNTVGATVIHPPNQIVEWSTLVGVGFYLLIFLGLRSFFNLLVSEPIGLEDARPNDISTAKKPFIQPSTKDHEGESPTQEDTAEEIRMFRFAVGKFNEYLLWFVIVLVLTMLIRFVLLLLGADPTSLFTGFIYALSGIIISPFHGIVRATVIHPPNQIVEWSTLVAVGFYLLMFLALRWFLRKLMSTPDAFNRAISLIKHKSSK